MSIVVDGIWQHGCDAWPALNGLFVNEYTAERFMERVRPYGFSCRLARIEGGVHSNDARYYTEQICAWVRGNDTTGLVPRDVEGTIRFINNRPPYLFVPVPPLDAATMRSLRTTFPKVVFLIATGRTLALPQGPNIVPLKPPIDTVREAKEYGEWLGAHGAAI